MILLLYMETHDVNRLITDMLEREPLIVDYNCEVENVAEEEH